jgi:septal ring factor EnvC (AmiA/AmiB activator)
MPDEDVGLRDRLSKQGEEALGKIASDLLENPLINSAITRAFSAREKAVHAQEAAMGALNLPSAADIDRLTRRLRTVSTRLEGIEEALDRVQDGVEKLSAQLASVEKEAGVVDRLARLDEQVSKLVSEVEGVSDAIDAKPALVPREQERLAVEDAPARPAARKQAPNRTPG